MRAHTGDFLKCELCGRNFIRNTHLKRHKLKKHGIMMNLDEPENLKGFYFKILLICKMTLIY